MEKNLNKFFLFCIYAFLAVTTFLSYLKVKNYDFIELDDKHYITENQSVRTGLTLQGAKWAFTTGHCSNWHPLTWMSHMLDCQLFGLNPSWHHLVNVIFHIANTLLLFAVLKAMTGAIWRSAFVAAAFALHPLHIESVAWIAERKDVLSTMFWFLTIAAYLRYTRKNSIPSYLLSLLLFALGLMSKPMLVTLPFTLLLLDYWPLNRYRPPTPKNKQIPNVSVRRLILEKIPFIALSIISSIITFLVQQKGGAMATTQILAMKYRLTNAVISYVRYLGKMIWPSKLAILYPFDATRLPLIQAFAAAALIIAITILVFRLGKNYKYLPVGWLWYVGTLVPVIGLVQVGGQSFADRYTYVPLIGIFIIIAWGIADITKSWSYKILLGYLSILVISAMAVRTYFQLPYWRDSLTIFNHAIDTTQRNGLIYCNLSAVYIKLGQLDKGIEAAKNALQVSNNYPDAHANLSAAYVTKGQYKLAIDHALETIKLRSDKPEGYSNLGAAYGQLGKYEEAILNFQKAVSIKPDLADTHYNLAVVYDQIGQHENAIKEFKKTLELDPKSVDVCLNLAIIYGKLNRHNDVINICKQALQIRPDCPEAHFNLGLAYFLKGDKKSALQQHQILKKIDPNWAERLLKQIGE